MTETDAMEPFGIDDDYILSHLHKKRWAERLAELMEREASCGNSDEREAVKQQIAVHVRNRDNIEMTRREIRAEHEACLRRNRLDAGDHESSEDTGISDGEH